MIKNWLKIYWRNLSKNKVYFALTLLGLALGIWGVLLSYLYYKEEVRYDQWNPYKDEVFIVSADLGDGDIWMLAPYPVGPVLKQDKQVIDDYMYLSDYRSSSLEFEGKKMFFSKALCVQANFFAFFPFEIIAGANALHQPQTAMVLDTYAETLFGTQHVIGKTFQYQKETYTITGLYSFDDTRSSIAPTMLLSGFDKVVADNQMNWGNYNASLYLKVKDITKLDKISKTMTGLMYDHVYARLAKEAGKTVEEYLEDEGETIEYYRFFPLTGQHMIADKTYNGTLEKAIDMKRFYILVGLSVTILVLSIVNYINLSLVQSLKRHREMGIRLVVGGTYIHLFLQLFFESCMTLILALSLSFVLIEFALPTLQVFLNSYLEFKLVEGLKFGFLFIILLALLRSTLLLVVMRKVPKLSLLKGQLIKRRQRFNLRHIMLLVQFSIASFFMISTSIVYKQVNYMLEKDLGFTKEQVMILAFNTTKNGKDRERLYETYKAELLQIPGVQGVGSSSLSIGGNGYNSSSVSHRGIAVQVMNVGVDDSFLDLMGIAVIEGRNLEKNLATDTMTNVLINKQLKDKFGDQAIVGKVLDWNYKKFTVVGVVDNYHTSNFKNEVAPMLFFRLQTVPWLIENIQEVYVRFDPAQTERIQADMEKLYAKMHISDYPFSFEFMDQRFERLFRSTIQERNILVVLSITVIFIALFGLYSVVSFTLANQYKEIAIRKVLGASNKTQLIDLSKRYIALGIIGFGLAVYPGYYFMNAWLSDFVFRIDLEWENFVGPFALLLILTTSTVLIKIQQAVQRTVLEHIKHE